MPTLTGRQLNAEWEVGARHALYRKDGRWYMRLERFPGALFDAHGYIVFKTAEAYRQCPHLSHGKRLNVYDGISSIPGYVRME